MSKSLQLKVMYDRYCTSPNSSRIIEEMLVQVSPYIDQLTVHLHYPHSSDDAAQICRLGFLRALTTYNKGKSEFPTYAFNCMKWALYSHLRNERGEHKKKVEEVLWCDIPLAYTDSLTSGDDTESWAIMKVTDLMQTLSPSDKSLLWDWASNTNVSEVAQEHGLPVGITRDKVKSLLTTLKERLHESTSISE